MTSEEEAVARQEEGRWFDEHCAACGRRTPRKARAWCAECGHAWRWGWLMSLHDVRSYWRATGGPYYPLPWYQRLRGRRPSAVVVCPCCSHDL